jgi:hypothetical protein
MKLVECLVAGIAGATSGTATFVLRGTASSAASVLYNDFEGTTQPGTNIITLDSNGCAEIYVNAYCDMTLKNQAGTTLRTVTVGDSATTVEVISDSFTGTDYSGSPTAASEPITLAAVLDKWNNSAGSTNWQVLINGVATNLSSAFASVSGIFVNVKDPAYGAVGDGVTDDSTAINNAILAAAGGIVFFPVGTYSVNALNLTTASFHLLGAGAGVSKISGNTLTGDIATITDNTASGIKIVEGLGFQSSVAYRYHFLLEEGQNVFFRNCVFDATNADSAISNNAATTDAVYTLTYCRFILGANTNSAILTGNSTEPVIYLLGNCTFTVASGFTGDILQGPGMNVSNCIFDASAVTAGSYYHIDAESTNGNGVYTGTFTGNSMIDGGSSGYAFKLTGVSVGCNLSEENNQFVGFADPVTVEDPGHIYDITTSASHLDSKIILGSRRGKVLRFTDAGDPIAPQAQVMAELIILTCTNSNNSVNINFENEMLSGQTFSIIAVNGDVNPTDFLFGTDHQTINETTVAFGGKAICNVMSYTFAAGDEEFMILSSEQGNP